MVLGAAAGAAAASGGAAGMTLFSYNRQNFMYDRKMRLETEYAIMEFKIKRAELFRDDVRDIIGLTSVKMDTYLVVNAVMLGFCVMMFCEGRLNAETPPWLVGCHTLALAGAFTYLLMSVWLSMHAVVAAKSYEVRLLTQLVRLPVPSWAQIEGARTYGSAFEKLESRQMFRVPFAMGTQEEVLRGAHGDHAVNQGELLQDDGNASRFDGPTVSDTDFNKGGDGAGGVAGNGASYSTDPWGLERPGDDIYELDGAVKADPRKLRHIDLVRKATQYWQSYDAFSRVSMSIGANQLVTALSYYVLGYVLVSNRAIIAAFLSVLLFLGIACALIRLDMSLSVAEYRTSVLLVMTGPICMSISSMLWAQHGNSMATKVLVPISYAAQSTWLLFILYISKIREQQFGVQLPTGFRSVMFVDVFGWIQDNFVSKSVERLARRHQGVLREPERINAAGPGIQSVRYADGRPVPMRVEQLPGASRAARDPDVSFADFAPNTFVPRERGDPDEAEAVASVEIEKAGTRPWKVFCGATSLLALLWLISGVLITLDLLGVNALKVVPLIKDHGNKTSFLQVGEAIPTKWPHQNVHAFGLACNAASNSIVVSSRFGLYTADISNVSIGNLVQFKAAPPCNDIEGESLQDVSLVCGSEGGACQAAVLHQQGRRLSRCDLATPASTKLQSQPASQTPSVALVADEWLSDGDASGKAQAESVRSLAFTSQCKAGSMEDCAYVGTSGGRLVKMRESAESAANRKWFPQKLLRQKLNGTESGATAVIHDRYLGLLQRDGRHVDVLDLENGGSLVDSYRFPNPSKHQAWTSMCAAGDSLFFLSDGPSPQLWRFAVPRNLRSDLDEGDEPAVDSTPSHRVRKHGVSHTSLGVASDGPAASGARSLRR